MTARVTGRRGAAATKKTTAPQYFLFQPSMMTQSAVWPVWTNERELRKAWRADSRKPFSNLLFSDTPQVTFDRKGARGGLLDAYPVATGWIFSDRLKTLLGGIDPEGFAFVPAEVVYRNFDNPGSGYLFADIVRWLDCVDEENSVIKYQENITLKNYLRLYKVKMRLEAVGSARAFRLEYSRHEQIVDDVIAKAIRAEKIKGFGLISLQD
jgi:hypothetical protein